jgi:hypothetical protein
MPFDKDWAPLVHPEIDANAGSTKSQQRKEIKARSSNRKCKFHEPPLDDV